MTMFLLIIHIITCICLIAIVLFQVGKGANMSTLFGGGSSDAVLGGATGSTLFKKITTGFAVVFMLTSLSLSIISAKRPRRSLMDIMPPAPVIPKDVLGQQEAVPSEEAQQEKETEEPVKKTK